MQQSVRPQVVGDRYVLLSELGAGGMGTVWRARDALLDRIVAVKEVRLPPELDEHDRVVLLARTMREARHAARLDEATVVRVYDVVQHDNRPWIIMELVDGTSLSHVIRQEGPLPSAAVARIGLAVLGALRAAHAAGIVHRDVKPSNVVLAGDGRVVLTDFGVATAIGDPTLTATGLLIGSPSFFPPERARGEAGDARSDLWSLGATLYTAVEGHPPFEREDALSTITAAIIEPHAPPERASPQLREVIDGLLAKDPADRMDHAAVEALLHAAAPGNARAPRVAAAPIIAAGTATPDVQQGSALPGARALPMPVAVQRSRPKGRRRLIGLALSVAMATGAAFAIAQLPAGSTPWADDPAVADSLAAGSPDGPAGDASVDLGEGTGTDAGTDTGAGADGSTGTPETPENPDTDPSSDPGSDHSDAPVTEVPDGFALHRDETGFSVAVPVGWTVVRDGTFVDFRDPAGGRFLRIDQTDAPQDDPLADWEAQEPSVAERLSNYQRIRIDAVQYRGWAAADWEFTHGESTHVLSRNLVTGPKAYAIYWSVTESRWAESLPILHTIITTFQPAAG